MPPGQFVMLDTTGAQRDAFYEDLGKRNLLLYYTAAEVAAL